MRCVKIEQIPGIKYLILLPFLGGGTIITFVAIDIIVIGILTG